MTDWAGIGASWTAAALAIGGSLVSYGMSRQKVNDLDTRLTEQGQRIDRLETAITKIADVGHDVDLLRASTEAAHSRVTDQIKAGQDLTTERIDGLGRELRAFMQGSGRRTRTAAAGRG